MSPALLESSQLPPRRKGRRGPLDDFFTPASVAVIGASERTASVGRALLENLRAFGGRVIPVNPRHDAVLGIPAYSRIGDIPGKVDLALIATPAATVPNLVRECGEAGVRAAVIHSAGFRECGAAGATLERAVFDAAHVSGVRIIGPNCLGLMVPHHGLNATFATTMARPGHVAFVSQSGALCTAVLDWSLGENVGFSAMVSVGSMADVGWGELITCLGDDPQTHSILLYMESIGDARSFLSAAREVAFAKPVIAVKVGRTATAAKAAASHTGALTGCDAVVDAAFRRAGILRVETIEELFDLAEVLGKQPRPRGPKLGIVTNAGGPAALATDRLVGGGGEAAILTKKSLTELDRILPAHWSHGNPVDILGDAEPARYGEAVNIVAADPAVDGLLVILTPQAMSHPLETAQVIRAAAVRDPGKPVLASWMGGRAVASGRRLLNAAGIPTFDYPDRAAQAFNHLWRYSVNVNALYETPMLTVPDGVERARGDSAGSLIGAARRAGRTLLTEHESKRILAAYGIPVVDAPVAFTEDEAVSRAEKIGFPVAIKLHSETVAHKAAVGGVVLDVREKKDVGRAWKAIEGAVTARMGPGHFQGVTVERMISGDGHEVILGSSIDPQFGPVLMFGTGGRWVERVNDCAFGFPPLTSTLALRLMEQTRIFSVLAGGSGGAPLNLAELEGCLVRFSQLVAAERWIKEIDVNPLFISADTVVALDARIIVHDAAVAERDLPRLAIRPYPRNYGGPHTLADGTRLTVRVIRPEDEPMMVRFHANLSDQSYYYRYFTAASLEQRTDHARLARLCFIDYDREIALVAVRTAPRNGPSEIIGVARLCRAHGNANAEFALVVADHWQRHGIGIALLRTLLDVAHQEQITGVHGTILAENIGMRRLCERAGFTLQSRPDGAEIEAFCEP